MKKGKDKNKKAKQALAENKHPNKTTSKVSDAQVLRNKAELIVDLQNVNIPESFEILNYDETLKVIHELQVHQIELEMQNDELHKIQMALSAEKQRYFNLYNSAPVGYCTLSEEGLIIEANLIAANLFGMSQSELAQQPISRFIHPQDQDTYYLSRKKIFNTQEKQSFELRLQSLGSTDLWVYVVASTEKVGEDKYEIRLVLTDISDRKSYESELNRIAKYDALTNLPNRTLLADRLYQGMALALRHKQPLALLFIDLDGFKEINADYGYEVGDQVLIRIAER
ncbi:MAG: diguanylate cyclase domain-containing protein, partial [Pseudomonadota bacterium]